MKPHNPDYKVINPQSPEQAAEALASEGKVLPLAGGTDLFVSIRYGNLSPCTLVNLAACDELVGPAEWEDGDLILKAMTTFKDVRYDENIEQKFPLLNKACRMLSVIPIQSRATWAGNVANASPCANGAAALMAYDAELILLGPDGERTVKIDQFFHDYKKIEMRDNEFIYKIRIPAIKPGWKNYYRDVGARAYQSISKTLLAGRIKINADQKIEDVRIACGSVAPYTLRCVDTEAALREEKLDEKAIESAVEALQGEIAPIDDIRSNQQYRRRVTENMLREFLTSNLS